MTGTDIRDLLAEVVEPLQPPDVALRAWDESVRRRRRRRTALGAGIAASALVIAAGALAVRTDGSGPPPASPNPTTDDAPLFEGYQVYRAPGLNDEAGLEPVEGVLPATIDLSAPNPSLNDEPIARAAIAFALAKVVDDETVLDGVMFVTADGQLRHFDAPELAGTTTRLGDPFTPFGPGALSADGTQLVVRADGGVTVYDLPSRTWTPYDLPVDDPDAVPSWAGEGMVEMAGRSLDTSTGTVTAAISESPLDTSPLAADWWWGLEEARGELVARSASYLNEDVPISPLDANPPAIVVDGALKKLLVIADQNGRWKNCCGVAGWIDDHTVVYDSASGSLNGARTDGETLRLLAWDLGDGEVRLVSTVTGSSDLLFLPSFADLGG